MFDYWETLNINIPNSLEKWISKYLNKYTGCLNIETIDNRFDTFFQTRSSSNFSGMYMGFECKYLNLEKTYQSMLFEIENIRKNNITDQEFELSGVTSEIERETIRNSGIANLLTGRYVLAFEAVSVTLLAALVGSLALARGRRTQ